MSKQSNSEKINLTEAATEYLRAGLSILPIDMAQEKKPTLLSWKILQSERMTEEEAAAVFIDKNAGRLKHNDKFTANGIGILTGEISGNLEVIDIDSKYDLSGSLWNDYTAMIEDNLPGLLKRLPIAKTISGGYHIFYRAEKIEGNKKLANRHTTPEERELIYKQAIDAGQTEEAAKLKAQGDKRRILIETRGAGGYVVAAPTKGYSFIGGSLGDIPTLTREEREALWGLARSFNDIPEEIEKPKIITGAKEYISTGLSPFEDYSRRGDVLELLEKHGWRIKKQTGQRVHIERPGGGNSGANYSGNYHTGYRVLRVWSSSTEFETDKGYGPAQVFTLLECNGDAKAAYRKLLAMGYGEPYKENKVTPVNMITQKIKVEVVTKESGVNSVNRVSSVISEPGETLYRETILTAIGEAVVISSPGAEAAGEVLAAIELSNKTGKRIYIQEGGDTLRDYRYRLQAILTKYGKKEEEEGGLSDIDRDNLLEEIVHTAGHISEPIDRDIFKKELLELPPIKELGITEESLSRTLDRISALRDKEDKAAALGELINKAAKLQEAGETEEAISLVAESLKEVKLKDKATEFSSFVIPPKEAEMAERLSKRLPSLASGYTIDEEEILLPSGALSIFAAPTSHGKTSLLINLALNVAQSNPEKQTYFFSYEEDADSITINTLNTYLDTPLSANNRRSIREFYATGSTDFIRKEQIDFFLQGKDAFFNNLIAPGRLSIHYTNYDADTLGEAILYLHKNHNPGAVFIDYFQLLNLSQGKYKTYSRQEELKQVCINLKNIAVETGLPIILGAQFNREVINQLRLHPTNIGEAGDIERIANLIVGLWNNNMPTLAKEGEANEINRKGLHYPNTIYAKILKNRAGRVGMEGAFGYNGNTGKIKNISYE